MKQNDIIIWPIFDTILCRIAESFQCHNLKLGHVTSILDVKLFSVILQHNTNIDTNGPKVTLALKDSYG